MSLLPPQSYAYAGRSGHHQIYEVDEYGPPSYNGNPLLNNPYLVPHSYAHSPYVPKHHQSKQARHQNGHRMSAGGLPSYSSPFKSASKYILPPGPVYDYQAPVYYGGPHPGHHFHRSFDAQNPYDMTAPPGYYPIYTDFGDDPYSGSVRAQSGGLHAEKAIEEIGKIRDLRRAFEDLKAPHDLLDRLQGLKSKGNVVGPLQEKSSKKHRRKNRKYEESFETSFATTEQTGSEDSFETERPVQQGYPQMTYLQNYPVPVVPVNYNGGYALAIVSQPNSPVVLADNKLIAVEPNQVNHPVQVQSATRKTYRAPEKYVPEQKTSQRGKGSQERSVLSIDEELDKKSNNESKEMLIFGNDAMLNDCLGIRRKTRRITTPKKMTHAQHVMQLVEASGQSTHTLPPRSEARKETLEEILIRNRVDEADMKVLKRTLKDVLYKPANLKESQEILEASFTNNNNASVTHK